MTEDKKQVRLRIKLLFGGKSELKSLIHFLQRSGNFKWIRAELFKYDIIRLDEKMRSEIAFLKKPFWSFYTFSKVLFPTIHKFRWLFDIFYSSSYGRGRGRILQCFCAFLHNSASFPKLGLRKTYRFFWCSSKEGENKLRKQLKWRLRIFRCHCFTLHFPIMCYCPDPQEHIYLVHTYFVFLQYVFFGGLSRSTPSSSCSPGNMHIWLNGTNGVCVCAMN